MANVQINPAQSAIQNLLNLVESQNPTSPSDPTQVTTSHLTAVTVGSIPSDLTANTTVEIDAASGQSRYQGSVVVHYAREAVADQVSAVGGTVTIPASAVTAAEQLAAVAAHYGFILSEISWVSVPVYPTGGGAATASIQAAGSIVYLDGTATVNLSWTARKTAMLMHFDGSSFVDSADPARTFSVSGGAALSTAQSKFGGSSYSNVIATGGNISTADAPELKLTGDFTIEYFYRDAGISGQDNGQVIYQKHGGTGGDMIDISSGSPGLYNASAALIVGAPASAIVDNTWQHHAWVREGNVWTVYIDGVQQGQVTDSTSTIGNNGAIAMIGNYFDGENSMNGFLDEFRISNIARYTAPFTPPIAAFTLD